METNYSTTGAQESLRTRDRLKAHRLFNAKNEAERLSSVNRQIALAYLNAGDPEAPKRTWQRVMDQVVSLKKGETKRRWDTAIKNKAFDELRKLTLSETRDNHLRDALNGVKTRNEKQGEWIRTPKVSTNVYLRRLHNFALDMNWLGGPIIPEPLWPKPEYIKKRAIKLQEYLLIVERKTNPERKAFYRLAWHTGEPIRPRFSQRRSRRLGEENYQLRSEENGRARLCPFWKGSRANIGRPAI